ncbi:CAIB/BAIF family protein [hydrothermal vent metagenome]|uniref:CAIB/BAIF family protein n=1 Tax=hydrothermal vent metagenome TaxID=652676 RepID=A0A3B0TF71_9ZZZZ
MTEDADLPLAGVRVIEFTHMVMGPAAGVILGDLGADVIKVEPIGGDHTRRLVGSGAGYFPMYNRNKKSICLDLKSEQGLKVAARLVRDADIVIENFRPGAMDRLGLGFEALSKVNPGLIYCSEKGFLAGPYEHRTALDEVAQMMGGLAYMTGPPGKPLRAGASVIDVMGGMFGVIGILAALKQRESTGRGQLVKSSLFESAVFLVGQHMAQFAVTGQAANPMPVRISAWAIYDVFETKDDQQVFVGIVSDGQWLKFCEAFDLDELAGDENYRLNADRVSRRDLLMPKVRELFRQYDKNDLMEKLEYTGLPFAPIAKPEDMFTDPHMCGSGGLLELALPGGGRAELPGLPLEMADRRFGVRHDLPEAGQHTAEILARLGFDQKEIREMSEDGVVQ